MIAPLLLVALASKLVQISLCRSLKFTVFRRGGLQIPDQL